MAAKPCKGDRVKLDGVVPSANYKGELQLKVDPHAIIVHASKSEHIETTLLDFRARWNVTGNLVYRFEKKGVGRNGKSWHRKGMMLLDETGSMKSRRLGCRLGYSIRLGRIGDTLVAANISLDALGHRCQGDRLTAIRKSRSRTGLIVVINHRMILW